MTEFKHLKSSIEKDRVKLVAVSKTKPASDILNIYQQGQRIFGENRVQEMVEKQPLLPEDIQWHMIGHLQRNKVKYIASFVSMIESVDNPRLLSQIEKEAKKQNRIIPVLLQIHIAMEETKFGFTFEELKDYLETGIPLTMGNIAIRGVMGMASFVDDKDQIRAEFKYLKKCFQFLKTHYFNGKEDFTEISMGMSMDYRIAIEEGSTIVRIGSLIFGARL
jgi:pyridoxal phosphate enzyme (YggS family)